MYIFTPRKLSQKKQIGLSLFLVVFISILCYFFTAFLGYKIVAFILLMTVSILAMLFDIVPVLISCVFSALVWNFFFIPPTMTFHIDNIEDLLLFLMYFFISSVNAVLTFKIRKEEKKVQKKEEEEKTIKLYNTLLNSLSHELRTPISTIIGAADTLKLNKINLTEENQLELLSQIEDSGLRLNRQVENLLNMSRLETGILKINKEWCDLNELIKSISKSFIEQQNHVIKFNFQDNFPIIKIDNGLMEQAINNLLHNAITHNKNGTLIEIGTKIDQQYCIITISDNGTGIPEKEIPLLFHKFYRLNNSKPGGCGLGLSISKGFIEAHNGNIMVYNNSQGGATFEIKFPVEMTYMNQLNNE